ncbi:MULTISPECIES: 4-oxalmesaconate hydratase [Chromohalobacter]|jgi:4-oxalomesaconate hydratase|uniref:LmbE-like protein n=1 Tax=Chromohalobacter israelensis (strain ATCC BAA-138 / DSM 3043 / CIP 106854 / NCIMB 13768 / 1H11) TaxID=290398 RepID=Q1R0R6_CHRI1|nr:4-oxalmesaconate hydratase [Chromohalobacter salexigens]ABE57692.1 LmbE-like protein [Chromohalobacter salexigens DSM 3043]MCT8468824.1 4-oxalmesaconate hydratase [Chromohalobacter canadensis]MCT8472986.1 4-oxalmesaconate hydratase [Chromohalobacter canadensis]MCT8500438.1 4-oxalmesaconate hydratase [Chromohalobacter canadensis]NWO55617.1 4-carboxy-2-hydroxymuconate hydratase [Chromohalobacter salexigens]
MTVASSSPAGLVVSAHSADFVWRAGGAIALHARQGYAMHIVCLSFGERGESAKLWRQGNMSEEKVKAARREEAEAAAAALGASVEFFDIGDYPMRADKETLFRLVEVYRRVQPEFVLTHSLKDPYNYDHPLATDLAQEARIIAQAEGHNPGETIVGAPPVYCFEPHQPEQCQWRPDVLLDITEVWDDKYRAIQCMAGQEHLWEYYTRVALQRGVQAKRNIGITANKNIQYAEGYQSIFPRVTENLA